MDRPKGIRRSGWTRIAGLGGTSAVAAVALIMVLSPVSQAASARASAISLSAVVSADTTQGACGKARLALAPSWDKKTGHFLGSVSSSSPKCKAQASPNEAISEEYVQLETESINFASALSHSTSAPTLYVNWSAKVNESWFMTPYSSCALQYNASYSLCTSYTEDTIYSYAMVDDLTNSSWGQYGYGYSFSNFVDIYTSSFAYSQNYSQYYCYAGSCTLYGGNYSYGTSGPGSFVGSLSFSNQLNMTGTSAIGPTDHYEVSLFLMIDTIAEAYTEDATGKGHPSASASINVGTHGNGVDLSSIVLT